MFNFNNTFIVSIMMGTLGLSGLIVFINLIVIGTAKKKQRALAWLTGASVCLALNMMLMGLLADNKRDYDSLALIVLLLLIVVPVVVGVQSYKYQNKKEFSRI